MVVMRPRATPPALKSGMEKARWTISQTRVHSLSQACNNTFPQRGLEKSVPGVSAHTGSGPPSTFVAISHLLRGPNARSEYCRTRRLAAVSPSNHASAQFKVCAVWDKAEFSHARQHEGGRANLSPHKARLNP